MPTSTTAASDRRRTQRQRHDVVLRHLQVVRTVELSASMRRVTLGGPELAGFASAGFDDHVKMFFPEPGRDEPILPSVGPDGLRFPENGPQPLARDLTPRRYSPEAAELDVDFALLHEGPASRWAAIAKPGDSAWVAGPRGSFIVPFDFDWHLLVADETGLPALARRLEELPAGSRALALIEVDGAADELPLRSAEGMQVIWVHREEKGSADRGVAITAALREARFPEGYAFAWIASESSVAKRLRGVLVDERGLDRRWVRAHGYWRQGATAVHDDFDD